MTTKAAMRREQREHAVRNADLLSDADPNPMLPMVNAVEAPSSSLQQPQGQVQGQAQAQYAMEAPPPYDLPRSSRGSNSSQEPVMRSQSKREHEEACLSFGPGESSGCMNYNGSSNPDHYVEGCMNMHTARSPYRKVDGCMNFDSRSGCMNFRSGDGCMNFEVPDKGGCMNFRSNIGGCLQFGRMR